jgi:hypothetical protein
MQGAQACLKGILANLTVFQHIFHFLFELGRRRLDESEVL